MSLPDLFSVIRITLAAGKMEQSITQKQKARIGFSVVRVLEQVPYNAVACEINMITIVNNPACPPLEGHPVRPVK